MIKIVEKELALLARWIVGRFHPMIIGVTGSAGKTTTKYFIGELLMSSEPSVRVASGNLNSETGLPLSVLGYTKAPKTAMQWLAIVFGAPLKATFTFRYPKYLILEYAADKPGDIEKLVRIARPDIAVISSIGVAHLEKFQKEENIIKEKWQLALAAKQAIIINRAVGEKLENVKKPEAEIFILPSIKTAKAENVEFFTNRTEFDFYLANKKFKTMFSYLGTHNIENLELAAFAVHIASGETELIALTIKNLSPQEGRGQRFFGKKDILVLDESYNANPASMRAALDIVKELKYGKKIAILGEMKEIGSMSEKAHEEIVQYAKSICDVVIGVGEQLKDSKLDRWYPNVSELEKEVEEIIEPNSLVLIKGSRSNQLDRIARLLA